MPGITKLGKYEIRRELGKGAMGIVYEGFDPFIERRVAIKTIQKSAVDKSEAAEAFTRFRREAQAAGRLLHTRIVSIYEYGEADDVAYIAMEFVPGRELKDYFDKRERFSIGEATNILLQLLDALDYSHRHGVVHRDIKPANIMITEDRQVKVADFGIAKIDTSHLTHAGTVLGTPAYMSPEQFSGIAVDHRTDLYSAGVILYQFLTGKKPFTGSVFATMHKIQSMAPKPPSEVNPDVPRAFDDVVAKALAKHAADRFQTAMEFIAALKAALASTRAPAARADDAKTTPLPPAERAATGDSAATDIAHWQGISTRLERGDLAALATRRVATLDATAMRQPRTEAPDQRQVQTISLRRSAQPEGGKPQHDEATVKRRTPEIVRGPRKEAAIAARSRTDADTLRQAWQAKVSEIQAEGARAKAEDAASRQAAATERARRKQVLAAIMAERGKKVAAILTEREAEAAAEKEMQETTKRRLQAEAQRKLQTDEAARREIEFAEARERANAIPKRPAGSR